MLYVKTREAWSAWLRENHEKEREVWLVHYKKHTGKPSIPYRHSLEEAIRFGWIDGLIRRVDDERYIRRFTPRRANSVWSLINKRIAEKFIREGCMSEAGLQTVARAKKNGQWEAAYDMNKVTGIPPALKEALIKDRVAWENFNRFTTSIQSRYIYWIKSAKREETQRKRIAKVTEFAKKNIKPTM